MDRNEIPHDPRHLGVPSGDSKTIFKPMVCLAQTMHLSYVKISTISKRIEWVSTWASSPSSTIECIHNDFWAYGTLVQKVHLSCTDINVVSERTEMRFYMTHIT
jgi:hypothetical protein